MPGASCGQSRVSPAAQPGLHLHLDEFLLAAEPALEVRTSGAGLAPEQLFRRGARRFDQPQVALEIGKAEQRNARLPRAEKLTGTADHEVLPRDLEAVVVLVDHLEPRLGRLRHRLLEEQDAHTLRGAAA